MIEVDFDFWVGLQNGRLLSEQVEIRVFNLCIENNTLEGKQANSTRLSLKIAS